MERKRVFVLGLDGMSPRIVERFVKEGILPNIKKLIEEGGFSKALPAIPAQTPENWATIATGAMPGTHGIAVWGRHDPGRPVQDKRGLEAMSSNLCKAEYIWEALARQGLWSIVFYFIGYPPTTDKAVYVDWFWAPNHYFFEIAGAACYLSYIPENLKKVIEKKRRALRGKASLIEFREASGWVNLPKSFSKPLETEITVQPKQGEPIVYYALILNSNGSGYDTLILSKEKDYDKRVFVIKPGEWSPWIREEFILEDGVKVGTVRFKLIELSKDGSRFWLYRSQVYPVEGFTYPPEVANELIERFGPYINEAVGRFYLLGLVDEKTMMEEFEYQIKWIANAAKYLMEKYNASFFILHWHFLDTLQHFVLGLADPVGSQFDPLLQDKALKKLKLGYQIADMLVGEFLKLVDEKTYLIVVSDHGNVPNRKRYSILRALAERGLIHVEKDEKGGFKVDWSKSKVFVDLTNVYVNLKSRYVNGVVEDSEYEKIVNEVIDVLRSCKDQDGEYVVLFALRREDAPLVGLWGPHIGDVVFVYSQGFTWGTASFETGSIRVGGANHGPQPPTAETELASNYAVFMITGPGIKKSYKRNEEFMGPVYLTDIAPTVAYLLGVKPPRHSRGCVLYDFLEGWDSSIMERKEKPIKFPREQIVLKGDVTDLV